MIEAANGFAHVEQPSLRVKAARAVCANSLSGFCRDVGGSMGCRNGRGLAPHWRNCVASDFQLLLHYDAADAVLALASGQDAPASMPPEIARLQQQEME